MITFAFYTIHFGSKLFSFQKRLYSSSLENRFNLLFFFADIYLSLILLGFFILLGFESLFVIPYFLLMFTLILVEVIKKKPITTKNIGRVYENYCTVTNI